MELHIFLHFCARQFGARSHFSTLLNPPPIPENPDASVHQRSRAQISSCIQRDARRITDIDFACTTMKELVENSLCTILWHRTPLEMCSKLATIELYSSCTLESLRLLRIGHNRFARRSVSDLNCRSLCDNALQAHGSFQRLIFGFICDSFCL